MQRAPRKGKFWSRRDKAGPEAMSRLEGGSVPSSCVLQRTERRVYVAWRHTPESQRAFPERAAWPGLLSGRGISRIRKNILGVGQRAARGGRGWEGWRGPASAQVTRGRADGGETQDSVRAKPVPQGSDSPANRPRGRRGGLRPPQHPRWRELTFVRLCLSLCHTLCSTPGQHALMTGESLSLSPHLHLLRCRQGVWQGRLVDSG